MSPTPSAFEIIKIIAATGPGALIIIGLSIAIVVCLVPHFLPETHGWRDVEKWVVIFDWGISLAAALIGLGIFLVEAQSFTYGFGYSWRYRFTLSGFFFAIAGQRIYSRVSS